MRKREKNKTKKLGHKYFIREREVKKTAETERARGYSKPWISRHRIMKRK